MHALPRAQGCLQPVQGAHEKENGRGARWFGGKTAKEGQEVDRRDGAGRMEGPGLRADS